MIRSYQSSEFPKYQIVTTRLIETVAKQLTVFGLKFQVKGHVCFVKIWNISYIMPFRHTERKISQFQVQI